VLIPDAFTVESLLTPTVTPTVATIISSGFSLTTVALLPAAFSSAQPAFPAIPLSVICWAQKWLPHFPHSPHHLTSRPLPKVEAWWWVELWRYALLCPVQCSILQLRNLKVFHWRDDFSSTLVVEIDQLHVWTKVITVCTTHDFIIRPTVSIGRSEQFWRSISAPFKYDTNVPTFSSGTSFRRSVWRRCVIECSDESSASITMSNISFRTIGPPPSRADTPTSPSLTLSLSVSS